MRELPPTGALLDAQGRPRPEQQTRQANWRRTLACLAAVAQEIADWSDSRPQAD